MLQILLSAALLELLLCIISTAPPPPSHTEQAHLFTVSETYRKDTQPHTKTKRHTTTHKTSGTFSNFQRHLLVGSLNLYDNPSTNNHTL